MERKVWRRPLTEVQKFEANEYVAACGDSGVEYYFECNAPRGTLYYYPNRDSAVDGVHMDMGREWLGRYKPCEDKHVTSAINDFYDGFVDYNENGRQDSGEGVIVWLEMGWSIFGGSYIDDYHATKNLDMDSWETTRS